MKSLLRVETYVGQVFKHKKENDNYCVVTKIHINNEIDIFFNDGSSLNQSQIDTLKMSYEPI